MADSSFRYPYPYPGYAQDRNLDQTGYATQQSGLNDDAFDCEEDVLSSIDRPAPTFLMSYEQESFNYGDILAQSSDTNAAPWDPHAVGVECDENTMVMCDMTLRPQMPQAYTISEGYSAEERSAKDSGYSSIRMDLGFCLTCWEKKKILKYFKNNADKTKHALTHSRPFKCEIFDCQNSRGFSTKNDLERHRKDKHCIQPQHGSPLWYRCAHRNCSRKSKLWSRKDNFKAHIERTHKDLEGQDIAPLVKTSEYRPSSEEIEALARKKKEPKVTKTKKPKKPKAEVDRSTVTSDTPVTVADVEHHESNQSEESKHEFGQWNTGHITRSWDLDAEFAFDGCDEEGLDMGATLPWRNSNDFLMDMNSAGGQFANQWAQSSFGPAESDFNHYF